MPLIQWIMQNLGGGVPTFQSTGGIGGISGSASIRIGMIYVPTGGVIIGGGADALILAEVEQSIYFNLVINSFYKTRFLLDIGDTLPGGFRVRSLRQYAGTNQYLIENKDGEVEWINDAEVPLFEDRDSRRLDRVQQKVYDTLQRLKAIPPALSTSDSPTEAYIDSHAVHGMKITQDGVRYIVSRDDGFPREISSEELENWTDGELCNERIVRQISRIKSRIERLSQFTSTLPAPQGVIYTVGDMPRDCDPSKYREERARIMRKLQKLNSLKFD